jgi:hypothetical protein
MCSVRPDCSEAESKDERPEFILSRVEGLSTTFLRCGLNPGTLQLDVLAGRVCLSMRAWRCADLYLARLDRVRRSLLVCSAAQYHGSHQDRGHSRMTALGRLLTVANRVGNCQSLIGQKRKFA